MKTIVIFYSRSGNTKFVAEEIATNLNSDIQPLIDKKDRQGILGYLWAGFDALMQKKTEIEEVNVNLKKYDLIFIGCPNWTSSLPPAMRTFLSSANLADKKVVLFCTQDSMGAEKIFNNLRRLMKSAKIVSEKYFNKVLKDKDSVREAIKEWLGNLKI